MAVAMSAIVHRDLKPANILLAKLGSQSSIVKRPRDRFAFSACGPLVAEHGTEDRRFRTGQAGG